MRPRNRRPGLVTAVLARAGRGEQDAPSELAPLVYDELKAIARRQLRTVPRSATLQTTERVHEASIELTAGAQPSWNDRCHFFAIAATAMRHLAVDHARKRSRLKRGGGQAAITLDRPEIGATQPTDVMLAIVEALTSLEELNPRLAVALVDCSPVVRGS